MVHSVAMIGLGAMGAPMAKRLQQAGFALTVHDVSDAALLPFERSGAQIARTAEDCAAADMVIVMVASPDQVRDVLLGEQGLIGGCQGGKAPLVALMGTMAPMAVREFAATLAPAGIRVIDAPVSGGTMGAVRGTLTIMTGGADDVVVAAEPVFACLGARRFHCGRVGAAQTFKILNNILGIANSVLSAETFRLALEFGLDLGQVARVFETSTGRNWISAAEGGPASIYASMLAARSFDAGLSIIRKDIQLASELASSADGIYPGIDQLTQLVNSLGDETHNTWLRLAETVPSIP